MTIVSIMIETITIITGIVSGGTEDIRESDLAKKNIPSLYGFKKNIYCQTKFSKKNAHSLKTKGRI